MKIDVTKLDEQITIRTMVGLLGGRIDEYPVIGTCVTLNGNRTCERDIRDDGNVSISYEWAEPGDVNHAHPDRQRLSRIYIGHKHSGPMLSCDCAGSDDGKTVVWRNLYSKGNYGKNYSHGGNWSAEARRTYQTALAAWEDRDYMVTGLPMDRRYTESQLLLDEVRQFILRF